MPHRSCTICRREDVAAIDADHGSVRKVAKRFGLTPATLDRHRHHDDHTKNRVNSGQIRQIDDEIRRLRLAQTNARKRKDSAAFIRLSGELRQWHTLKAKVQGASIPEKDAPAAPVSERELLQAAISIVESRLTDPDVCSWILGLAERLRPASGVELVERAAVAETDAQVQVTEDTDS
jgi:hypothetical protein